MSTSQNAEKFSYYYAYINFKIAVKTLYYQKMLF